MRDKIMADIRPQLNELDLLLEDLSNTRNSFQERSSSHSPDYYGHDEVGSRGFDAQKKAVITEMKHTAVTTNNRLQDPTIDQSKWEYQGYGIWQSSEDQAQAMHQPKAPQIIIGDISNNSEPSRNGNNHLDLDNTVHTDNGKCASTATEELDELISSLNEYKIKEKKANSGQKQDQESEDVTLDAMLDNLQEDMSKQGVKTTQKGVCSACNKPIAGQVITALGKTFHLEHFVCKHCNKELSTEPYFERDGEPYCEQDYHKMFSPRCPRCGEAILDKCVSAMDETWHPDCFVCQKCDKAFGADGFHEMKGKAYCQKCFQDTYSIKCGGCGKAILDTYISSLDQHWHAKCFVCTECREPFTQGNYFEHEKKPYCETHYHALRGSLCAGCQKPISGRCITAMFRKFHPEHFVCSFCLKQLNKGTFKEKEDKPYCHGCFDRLFG